MTHLSMEQLLRLRDAASEPGSAEAQEHLAACAQCTAELDRLHQRQARLKALPTLRPPRDHFPSLMARVRDDRRQRRVRGVGLGALALAASLLLVVVGGDLLSPAPASASDQLTAVMAESATLERALGQLRQEPQVTDAWTTGTAASLEARIADLDSRLEALQSSGRPSDAEVIPLWRERVGLMDALVDVHLTRAQHVGL